MPVLVAVSHATWGRGNGRQRHVCRSGASGGAARRAKRNTSRKQSTEDASARGRGRRRGSSDVSTARRVRPARSRVRPIGSSRTSHRRRVAVKSAFSIDEAVSSRGGNAVAPARPRAFPRRRACREKRFGSACFFANSMGDRFRGRRRTLESGSWARQASRTPSEIYEHVRGGYFVSGASEKHVARLVVDAILAFAAARFRDPSGEKATVRVARERPNRRVRDHAPGPRACRGDPR